MGRGAGKGGGRKRVLAFPLTVTDKEHVQTGYLRTEGAAARVRNLYGQGLSLLVRRRGTVELWLRDVCVPLCENTRHYSCLLILLLPLFQLLINVAVSQLVYHRGL